MVSKKLIEEIKNKVSIPVIEGIYSDFDKKLEEIYESPFLRNLYGYKRVCKEVVGMYHTDPDSNFIFIHKNEPNHVKLWALLHEIGHRVMNRYMSSDDLKAIKEIYQFNVVANRNDPMTFN